MKAPSSRANDHPSNEQRFLNPRSGRYECVFVKLEDVYPNPENPSIEFCFEELRAAKRGYLQEDWGGRRDQHRRKTDNCSPIDGEIQVSVPSPSSKPQRDGKKSSLPTATTTTLKLNDIDEENDENVPPESDAKQQKVDRARKLRREEKANRTKPIKLKEVKHETQTSKC